MIDFNILIAHACFSGMFTLINALRASVNLLFYSSTYLFYFI